MTKEIARGIQTALWAALVLVQMTVVGALQVRAETVRREVTYEAVEGEAKLPDEITVSVLAGNGRWIRWKRMLTGGMIFPFPSHFMSMGRGNTSWGRLW